MCRKFAIEYQSGNSIAKSAEGRSSQPALQFSGQHVLDARVLTMDPMGGSVRLDTSGLIQSRCQYGEPEVGSRLDSMIRLFRCVRGDGGEPVVPAGGGHNSTYYLSSGNRLWHWDTASRTPLSVGALAASSRQSLRFRGSHPAKSVLIAMTPQRIV